MNGMNRFFVFLLIMALFYALYKYQQTTIDDNNYNEQDNLHNDNRKKQISISLICKINS